MLDWHGMRSAGVASLLFLRGLVEGGCCGGVAGASAINGTDIQEVSGHATRARNDEVHATLLDAVRCLHNQLRQHQLLVHDQAGIAEAAGGRLACP